MNSSAASATLRIGPKSGYCSGVLVAADLGAAARQRTDLALTCAHFFNRERSFLPVKGEFFHATVTAHRTIRATDLAVVRLSAPAPPQNLPAVATTRAGLFRPTVTSGFGGHATTARLRHGRVLARVPLALSRDLGTFVRSGAMLYNSPAAIHGDSGGPVMIGQRLVGLQSLILDPFGHNLRIATISQLAPHLRAIRSAIAELAD